MAAPDPAARLQMISMARPPSMYTVCFRSSRLIRYRCACRSTRKRMSTTFCSRSRSRRPACRSSGRAPSRGFALTRSVGHPSTLPRRCLRSRVGSCTPWPSRPRSQHSTARAAARCRSGSAATTPRLHSKAPPPWAASKRARRHRGCQANKGRSVAPIPLPHPLPHHPPPSLLLLFSRAHARARGVQANLGTAAALRATKRSSGLQVRRPSTTARNRHTARCGTPRSHPPSLPLPPSRRRPLRSAQRPVPSRRPLARRPTSRQSTAELGRRRASAVAWRIRSRRMGGPTGWAPCLRASRTGSTATCPPASATPRRRMACRTLSRPGRHRPPSVSTLPLPAPTPLSPLVGTRRCTTCRCTCRSQPRRRNGGGRCAMARRQWAWDTCRRPRRLTSEPRTRRRRRCTELPLASETRTRPSTLAHPRSPLLASLQSRRPSNATA